MIRWGVGWLQGEDRQHGAAARRGGSGARDVDMEVSFMPGLDLGQQLYDKKRDKQSRQAETVWQAYERRRKCAQAPASPPTVITFQGFQGSLILNSLNNPSGSAFVPVACWHWCSARKDCSSACSSCRGLLQPHSRASCEESGANSRQRSHQMVVSEKI